MKKPTKPKVSVPNKPAAKAPKKTTAAAPTVKASSAKPVITTIAAQIDVGFGNALYIRGDGPGLSWEQGTLMTCVADDQWSIELKNATAPVVCKFLLNDLVWCGGEDFVVEVGQNSSFVPLF